MLYVHQTMFRALIPALFLLSTFAAVAAPSRYELERDASSVGFRVGFGPDEITGTLPVRSADILLDFDNPPNSRVAVVLGTRGAKASFPFATQALRGPKVLSADAHPTLSFSTSEMRADGRKARVQGTLTIRGVARPIALDGQIFRQQGSADGDLSRLSVHLSGAVSRSAFGADGWSDMVGDTVALDIRVRIRRSD